MVVRNTVISATMATDASGEKMTIDASQKMTQDKNHLTTARRAEPAGRRRLGASNAPRRGAVAVEFALVAPLIFLVVFAGIEFGRVLTALHELEAATREGCRIAVASGVTQDVEDIVAERMSTFGITGYTLTTDPADVSSAAQWAPVKVEAEVTYAQVSWLPVPAYIGGITLRGSCTLPQETGNDSL